MKIRVLATLALFGLAGTAYSNGNVIYTCTKGTSVRKVEVAYPSGSKLPCQVNYTKSAEQPGETQILYTAQSQEGFCEKKAYELSEKLKTTGYACESTITTEKVEIKDKESEAPKTEEAPKAESKTP